MKKEILALAALLFTVTSANATMVDSSGNGSSFDSGCSGTWECHTETVSMHTEGDIVSEQAVWHWDQIVLNGGKNNYSNKSPKWRHCTDPAVYDSYIEGIGGGTLTGYSLAPDGQSIIGPDREILTRCLPARIDKGALAKKERTGWWEHLTISEHWVRDWSENFIVCSFSPGVTAPVPEPTTVSLFGAGLAAFAFVGRRKRG